MAMNATGANSTNGTYGNATRGNVTYPEMDLDRVELLRFCIDNEDTSWAYIAALPLWVLMLGEWTYNVYWRHQAHALDLHRLLTSIPLVGVAHSALSIAYYELCPWDSLYAQFAGAAWIVLTILKEPVILVCLLAVAKGWCITRQSLSSAEMIYSTAIVALLYTAVVVQLSLRHALRLVPMMTMWLAMLINIMSATITNLRVLKAQLLAIRSFNVDATTTPAFTKYQMYRSLLWCTAAYFLFDSIVFTLAVVDVGKPYVLAGCRQSLELITTFAIGYTFRARPFNVMFEHVQQLAVDLAQEMLPQLDTVTIDIAALRGNDTVPWSRDISLTAAAAAAERTPPPSLLVINPADDLDLVDDLEGLLRHGGTDGMLVVATRIDKETTLPSSPSQADRGGQWWRQWVGGSGAERDGSSAPVRLPMATLRELLLDATPWQMDGRRSCSSSAAISISSTGGGASQSHSPAGSRVATAAAATDSPTASGRVGRSPPRQVVAAGAGAGAEVELARCRVSRFRETAVRA